MSNVAIASHPRQPQAQENEPNIMHELRRRRAVALVPTVHAVRGGFRVSSSCREIDYLVSQPNGHQVCTCPDYLRHEEEEGFACKHLMAVEMALQQGLVNGNGHASPAPSSSSSSPAELAVLHRHLAGEDPVRLKLIKNTKGYSWEISVAEKDPQAATAPAMSHEPTTESPDFEQLRQAMQHCLNAGYEAWEKLEVDLPFTTEDVRRVGITLFLECVRQEILPQTSGEGLPF